MIQAIGIDSIEINRFAHWHTYQQTSLLKIFSPDEIAYCVSNSAKSAERFAVRFAAKEAFYKAFSTMIAPQSLPLLTICKNISIVHSDQRVPQFHIKWDYLWKTVSIASKSLQVHVSLTHSRTMATAFVIFEQNNSNNTNNTLQTLNN